MLHIVTLIAEIPIVLEMEIVGIYNRILQCIIGSESLNQYAPTYT